MASRRLRGEREKAFKALCHARSRFARRWNEIGQLREDVKVWQMMLVTFQIFFLHSMRRCRELRLRVTKTINQNLNDCQVARNFVVAKLSDPINFPTNIERHWWSLLFLHGFPDRHGEFLTCRFALELGVSRVRDRNISQVDGCLAFNAFFTVHAY